MPLERMKLITFCIIRSAMWFGRGSSEKNWISIYRNIGTEMLVLPITEGKFYFSLPYARGLHIEGECDISVQDSPDENIRRNFKIEAIRIKIPDNTVSRAVENIRKKFIEMKSVFSDKMKEMRIHVENLMTPDLFKVINEERQKMNPNYPPNVKRETNLVLLLTEKNDNVVFLNGDWGITKYPTHSSVRISFTKHMDEAPGDVMCKLTIIRRNRLLILRSTGEDELNILTLNVNEIPVTLESIGFPMEYPDIGQSLDTTLDFFFCKWISHDAFSLQETITCIYALRKLETKRIKTRWPKGNRIILSSMTQEGARNGTEMVRKDLSSSLKRHLLSMKMLEQARVRPNALDEEVKQQAPPTETFSFTGISPIFTANDSDDESESESETDSEEVKDTPSEDLAFQPGFFTGLAKPIAFLHNVRDRKVYEDQSRIGIKFREFIRYIDDCCYLGRLAREDGNADVFVCELKKKEVKQEEWVQLMVILPWLGISVASVSEFEELFGPVKPPVSSFVPANFSDSEED